MLLGRKTRSPDAFYCEGCGFTGGGGGGGGGGGAVAVTVQTVALWQLNTLQKYIIFNEDRVPSHSLRFSIQTVLCHLE